MPLTKVRYDMIDDEAKSKLVSDGGAAAKTTANVIASSTIGFIEAGYTLPTGTTLQAFVEELLTTTFYPTFTNPSASLGTSGNLATSQELGSLITPTLSAAYTAGTINGVLTNNIWVPSSFQAAWTGAATKYTFSGSGIEGNVDNGTTSTYAVSEQTIGTGGLSYTVVINYAAGTAIAINSKGLTVDADGNTYTVHASGSVTANLNFTGFRKLWYGVSSADKVIPTDNSSATSICRALTGANNPSNGTTFTLNPVAGTKKVIFAYPGTLRDVTSVIDSATGYNIKDSFTKRTDLKVAGANSYDVGTYKIYTYTPDSEAYTQATTYTVTI